jgi:hypothetical protein
LWTKKKKKFERPTKLDKFSETGWRWLYYSAIFAFGLVINSIFAKGVIFFCPLASKLDLVEYF